MKSSGRMDSDSPGVSYATKKPLSYWLSLL